MRATLAIVVCVAVSASSASGSDQRVVALSDVVTTSSQNGLRNAIDVLSQAGKASTSNEYLQRILGCGNGSSNAFLVDAANAIDAIAATSTVLIGERTADVPAMLDTANPKSGTFWLFVYLGTGSSRPIKWSVEGVGMRGTSIELKYRKSKPSGGTEDSVRYCYWIPLGGLSPNIYEVRLVDAENNSVSLMRRVEVGTH